jgi:hypothetical protein
MPTPAILNQPNKEIFKYPIYIKLENTKQGLIKPSYTVKSIILHYLNPYITFLVASIKMLIKDKNPFVFFIY